MTPSSAETSDLSRAPVAVATARADRADPVSLLRAFPGLPRGFWGREGRWSAWAGSAARIGLGRGHADPFAAVRAWGEASTGEAVLATGDAEAGPPRFFGGFAFEAGGPAGRGPDTGTRPGPGAPTRPDAGGTGAAGAGAGEEGIWAGFPGALFHLPAVELRGGPGGTRLRLAATSPAGGQAARRAAERGLARLRRRLTASGEAGGASAGGPSRARWGSRRRAGDEVGPRPRPGVRRTVGRPGPDGWDALVRAALAAIRSGRLEKVVPARLMGLELSAAPDPVDLLGRLRALNPGCFPYLVEPEPGVAFAGAAPEIVAARQGRRFHATAVAGTVPDSEDPAEQAELARRLLESPKDRVEHEIGVRDMRRALAAIAGVAQVDEEPRVLRLRGLQHLLTNLSAEVPPRLHVLELLEAMHPTAAVNGAPRDEARAFLSLREPFDRGWYAGPVGWFDARGDGEFAPALRCALLRGRDVHLLAGAGIVRGSDPGREWDETTLKLGPALESLGLDPDSAGAAAGCVSPGGAERLRPR